MSSKYATDVVLTVINYIALCRKCIIYRRDREKTIIYFDQTIHIFIFSNKFVYLFSLFFIFFSKSKYFKKFKKFELTVPVPFYYNVALITLWSISNGVIFNLIYCTSNTRYCTNISKRRQITLIKWKQ